MARSGSVATVDRAVVAGGCRKLVEDLEQVFEELVAESRKSTKEAVIERDLGHGRRLIVAHSPEIAKRSRRARAERLVSVLRTARGYFESLEAQDRGERGRGRPLMDEGAKMRLFELIKTSVP